jgi:preprotein translocase subunit SecD
VKGFAFTLGMSTVLDLVVVFLFTHPLMAVLSQYRWFGNSRISGLGRVEHTRRPSRSPSAAARDLVGARSAGGADRSSS